MAGSILSTSTRLKMSAQVSSGAVWMPAPGGRCGKRVAIAAPRRPSVASRSMPAKPRNASATVRRSGGANGSALRRAEGQRRSARGFGGEPQQRRAVLHQPLVGLARPIPFQHGERRVVQRAALAIAEGGAKVKIFSSPAASSFLQANSGEVCR